MHCHTEFHNLNGMGLYLKVGEEEEMNAAPASMNTCGDFDWSSQDFLNRLNTTTSAGKA